MIYFVVLYGFVWVAVLVFVFGVCWFVRSGSVMGCLWAFPDVFALLDVFCLNCLS